MAPVQDLAFKPAERQTPSTKGGARMKQENASGKITAGQGLLLLEPPSVPTGLGTNEIGTVDEDAVLLLDGQVI